MRGTLLTEGFWAKGRAAIVICAVASLLAGTVHRETKAESLNCSLLSDNLETNVTLSLKTAETLLISLSSGAIPDNTLVGQTGPQLLFDYTDLANLMSGRISMVIDDLMLMNEIGSECIKAKHFEALIGQARSANNIDQYLHERFTGASSDTSVFLSIATARTLLGRAIKHKQNVLSTLIAEGYFSK